jgi:hypothetical protein
LTFELLCFDKNNYTNSSNGPNKIKLWTRKATSGKRENKNYREEVNLIKYRNIVIPDWIFIRFIEEDTASIYDQ